MIKIICVGKVKEGYIKAAVNDYLTRLSKYAKVKLIETEEFNNSSSTINLQKEKEVILKHVNTGDYIIILDIKGKQLTSVELSNKIERLFVQGRSNIVFIIGGSEGIDEELKVISDFKLSFSKMTFPHQLFRVVLLEQLYRTFKIINNETYHK